MVSTYTTRNRLERQGTGENTNSWGSRLNSYTTDLVDASIDGWAAYTLSGTKTLSSANGAADEARMKVQHITGGTGGTVTVPAVEKTYFVINEASGSVVFTCGGTTATVPTSTNYVVVCDGTDCYAQTPIEYEAVVGDLAALLRTTSVTSLAIGTGSKAFTVEADKGFATGQVLRAADTAAPATNYMVGTVASYSGTTLTLTVTETGGSGTIASWSIFVTGTTGETGSIGDKQEFTSSGTWTKPSGSLTAVLVRLYGAGGGGGSGRRGAAASARQGGGGGGGGGYIERWYDPDDLSATETVTIGAGGAGGAAVSADDTAGNSGSNGGVSTFSSGATLLQAGGGEGGTGGNTTAAGDGGYGGFLDATNYFFRVGEFSGSTATSYLGEGAATAGYDGGDNVTGGGGGGMASGTGDSGSGGASQYGGGGGGAGGGITTGDVDKNAGQGAPGGGLVAYTSATAGTAGANYSGGTGGENDGTRTGGAGGTAGGGGGGSASVNGTASGAGGAGGDGYAIVFTW